MDYWAGNLAVVRRRWPQLAAALAQQAELGVELQSGYAPTLIVEGIQLTSNYDRLAEAEAQAAEVATEAPVVMLYGLGLGELPRLLLARPATRQLLLQVMNLALLRSQLTVADHGDWLVDVRLNLIYDVNQQSVLHPFAVATGDLLLADRAMVPLRDRLQLALNQRHLTAQHRPDDPAFVQRLAENDRLGGQDPDLQPVLGRSGRAWIAAAGPSLAQSLPLYQRLKQPGDWLVAVDAAVSYLLQQGVVPDLVVSIDATAGTLFRPEDYQHLAATPLVYFPTVDPQLLGRWQGPRHRAYGSGAFFDGLVNGQTASRLFCAGSVLHSAVDLCVQAGCNPLLLLGTDFGFCGETTHAGRDLDVGYHLVPGQSGHWLPNWRGQPIATWANFKGYLRDLEDYVAAHPQVSFYCMSDQGAAIAGCQLWPGVDSDGQ